MGSGALSSLHMIHGTPVSSPTAIFAAQFIYASPAAPSATLSLPYSFSIYSPKFKCKKVIRLILQYTKSNLSEANLKFSMC